MKKHEDKKVTYRFYKHLLTFGISQSMSVEKLWCEDDESAKKRVEQARSLKQQAKDGGLKFEAYLPPSLAEWVLDMVENGNFVDPSEAVFVYMGQAHDIEPYDDIKRGLLKRQIAESETDIAEGKTYSSEEVMKHLEERRSKATPAAVWTKIRNKNPHI